MAREIDMTGITLPSAAAPPQLASPLLPTGGGSASGTSGPTGSRPPQTTSERPLIVNRRRDDFKIPMLLSTIVHTLLLILLALFSYSERGRGGQSLQARQGEPSQVLSLQAAEQAVDRSVTNQGALGEQPIAVTIAPRPSVTVASPLAEPNSATELPIAIWQSGVPGGLTASHSALRLPSGGGLDGRTPQGRLELGRKYGATRQSEQAVDDALRWLAEHQRPDGSWSFNLQLDPCNGRCRNSKKGTDTPTPSTGATGLALLAFLGAGHTHHGSGPYTETVRRGIYYLRGVAGEAAAGYDWQQGSMYGHGIALMALSEALAMTSEDQRRDADLLDLVMRGTSFTCVAQHDNGSWGYVPGSPGDTTVTGWQVLSLLAARRNRVDLQSFTLRDAKDFVMSTCTDRDYWFGYKSPPGEPTTTAIGLTLMLYLGESPEYTPFYMALSEMADRGPTLTNIYHDYYATLALHHSRHRDWDLWNTRLRDHLIATQEQSGHEKGSWHFPDKWGDIGGRLYTTAMCAMTLEIYYRYLPLYSSMEEFPL